MQLTGPETVTLRDKQLDVEVIRWMSRLARADERITPRSVATYCGAKDTGNGKKGSKYEVETDDDD